MPGDETTPGTDPDTSTTEAAQESAQEAVRSFQETRAAEGGYDDDEDSDVDTKREPAEGMGEPTPKEPADAAPKAGEAPAADDEVGEFLKMIGAKEVPAGAPVAPNVAPAPEPKAEPKPEAQPIAGVLDPKALAAIREQYGDEIAGILDSQSKALVAAQAQVAQIAKGSEEVRKQHEEIAARAQAEERTRVISAANKAVDGFLTDDTSKAIYGSAEKMTRAQAAARHSLIQDAAIFQIQSGRAGKPVSDEKALALSYKAHNHDRLIASADTRAVAQVRSSVVRRSKQIDVAATGRGSRPGAGSNPKAEAVSIVAEAREAGLL